MFKELAKIFLGERIVDALCYSHELAKAEAENRRNIKHIHKSRLPKKIPSECLLFVCDGGEEKECIGGYSIGDQLWLTASDGKSYLCVSQDIYAIAMNNMPKAVIRYSEYLK